MRIGYGATLTVVEDGDIVVEGSIIGGSNVSLTSRNGSITVVGEIGIGSRVSLFAAIDIIFGTESESDNRIVGRSNVIARAGRRIIVNSWIGSWEDRFAEEIDSTRTTVDLVACTEIMILRDIAGAAVVRLWVGSGNIIITGRIVDGAVSYWPADRLQIVQRNESALPVARDWAGTSAWCPIGVSVSGAWWQNWGWSYGYVAKRREYPRCVDDIVMAVRSAGRSIPLKAVGGGWSFTDASLPFLTQDAVDHVSIQKRGASRRELLVETLEGLQYGQTLPMDLEPQCLAEALSKSSTYNQGKLTRDVQSSPLVPGTSEARFMDTRGVASSLQSQLSSILSDHAVRYLKERSSSEDPVYYFHVEAGITMADLNQLLDHQSPRMAIQAGASSSGGTLAGTLSTATHGGEFKWPLMMDRVRAIHLVDADGEQWWVEGDQRVADEQRLRLAYPKVDHFINADWGSEGKLSAQDILNAVVVSMGTMGVIYSIVLEVVPQFGVQQIVTPAQSWTELVRKAGTSENELSSDKFEESSVASKQILDYLLDGDRNGTGVNFNENIYVNLAITPYSKQCWITNRRKTPNLPIDSNNPITTIGESASSIANELAKSARNDYHGSKALYSIMDFLDYGVEDWHILNNIPQAQRLINFLTRVPDAILGTVAATLNVKAIENQRTDSVTGQGFLDSSLTGILNSLLGTNQGGINSDHTDISHKVGAMGWPGGGVPGRALEIALAPEQAFAFLQKVLFDEILQNVMINQNNPLIGYFSIRACPPTDALMGMQQFFPYTVMIEIVGYRSPESNAVMDSILHRILEMIDSGRLSAMLHWGLETDGMTPSHLEKMPIAGELRPGHSHSKLSAFKEIRQMFTKNEKCCFDNNFTRRLEL
jgi:FAD binding domain